MEFSKRTLLRCSQEEILILQASEEMSNVTMSNELGMPSS